MLRPGYDNAQCAGGVGRPENSSVCARCQKLNGRRAPPPAFGVYYASREVDAAIAETVFHMGRFYAATGDGLLVEFNSVIDAVRCAAELQQMVAQREAGEPEDA